MVTIVNVGTMVKLKPVAFVKEAGPVFSISLFHDDLHIPHNLASFRKRNDGGDVV